MSTTTLITLGFIWVLIVFILWVRSCIKYFRTKKVRNEKRTENDKWRAAIRKMVKNGVIR